jgi:hypothetical protein
LNNSDIHNPGTGHPRTPSNTTTTGFIYSTYWAAGTEDHVNKALTKTPITGSHQKIAYLSSAVGGSVSTISFEDIETRDRTRPHTRHGGTKGKIKGFSRVSRRNLLRRLASINRQTFRASKGRLISVTLTYPAQYPQDPEVCKSHLKALRKRLQRKYGCFAAFWRMGIQRRGAFHFHLLLFVPLSFGSVKEARRFVSTSWYEVCGEISEGHLHAGTRVEEVRSWKRATSYAEKYLAKKEEFPEESETGRIWGVWNQELLPVRWETVRVGLQDAYKIRRVYRKLARLQGTCSLRRLTVFVRHDNVIRLLRFLEYRLE